MLIRNKTSWIYGPMVFTFLTKDHRTTRPLWKQFHVALHVSFPCKTPFRVERHLAQLH